MSIAARAAALLTTLALTACVSAREPEIPAGGRAEPPIRVGVLLLDGFYATDVLGAYEVLGRTRAHAEPGMVVVAVGRTREPVRALEGLRMVPDHTLADAPGIDVLVVPGGRQSDGKDLEDLDLIQWISARGQKARHVMGIGRGSFLLAESGLLRDRQCTLSTADAETFRREYPHLEVIENRLFLVDHEVVTGQGGVTAYAPAIFLVAHLCGKEACAAVAREIGHRVPEDIDPAPRPATK